MKTLVDRKKDTSYSPLPTPGEIEQLPTFINNELQVLQNVVAKLNDDILMIRTHLGI